MLVDKAYPSWAAEERLELVRNQFIHGILSSSIQLKLLQEQVDTLEAAIELACRLESVESALKSFQTVKTAAGVTTTLDCSEGAGAGPHTDSGSYQELVAQVKSLSQQLDTFRKGKTGPRSFRGSCWECGRPGYVRRNCPQRRRDQNTKDRGDRSVQFTSAVACTLTLRGAVEGHPTVMLVDTGSSVTILHESIWKMAVKGKKELKQATCPVMAVNGESLPLCGQAEVNLQVGSYSGVHNVLVVRDMTQQCLLGTDFLEQCHCIINMGAKTLTIGGMKQQVPLLSGKKGTACHVAVQETTVIPTVI